MRCEGYMLITKDIKAATEFYTDIIGASVELDIGNHVVFREGFSLLLESDWRGFTGLGAGDVFYRHHTGQLSFEVDDIQEFLERIESLPPLALLHPAKEHHWGKWSVRLYDPDRHVVEVGESMKVVVKRFLSQGLAPEEAAARSEFPLAYVLMCKDEMEKEAETGRPATPN